MSQPTSSSTPQSTVYRTFPTTTGLDLASKKTFQYTVDPAGECASQGYVRTTRQDFQRLLAGPPRRVVMEACGSCRWVAKLCEELGHEVIIANPVRLHFITKDHRKDDARDARQLAETGQLQPHNLHPVRLRSEECQRVRLLMGARRQLVGQRQELVCFVRGQMRSANIKIPRCSTTVFAKRSRPLLPEGVRAWLEPILTQIETLSSAISGYDKEVERLGTEEFPDAQLLRQIPGVGPVLSLAYVVTLDGPEHFKRSRDIGAWTGLTPRRKQTGNTDPQLRISKCGDSELRRLLVAAATWILGPFGPDCDLRRYGERIRARGDQTSKGKARIAVARKLSVLMHRLWRTGEVYEPFHNSADRIEEPVADEGAA